MEYTHTHSLLYCIPCAATPRGMHACMYDQNHFQTVHYIITCTLPNYRQAYPSGGVIRVNDTGECFINLQIGVQ